MIIKEGAPMNGRFQVYSENRLVPSEANGRFVFSYCQRQLEQFVYDQLELYKHKTSPPSPNLIGPGSELPCPFGTF